MKNVLIIYLIIGAIIGFVRFVRTINVHFEIWKKRDEQSVYLLFMALVISMVGSFIFLVFGWMPMRLILGLEAVTKPQSKLFPKKFSTLCIVGLMLWAVAILLLIFYSWIGAGFTAILASTVHCFAIKKTQ